MTAAGPPTETPEPTRPLARRARRMWRLEGVAAALAVAAVALVITLAGGGTAAGLAWAAAALVALLGAGAAPELRWRRWRWEVREAEVDIRHGTLVVTRTLVPMLRVQHVDTRRGLLEQWLGLATVVFHTAAGANKIPALDVAEAGRVRDRIAELARHVDDEP
jgi:uncharacterized protein